MPSASARVARESYLRIPNIMRRRETTRLPGQCIRLRFLGRIRPSSTACVENDLVFVGPPADVMAQDGRQDRGETGDAPR